MSEIEVLKPYSKIPHFILDTFVSCFPLNHCSCQTQIRLVLWEVHGNSEAKRMFDTVNIIY